MRTEQVTTAAEAIARFLRALDWNRPFEVATGLAARLYFRLTPEQRLVLAAAALYSLPDSKARDFVARAAAEFNAGRPVPPLYPDDPAPEACDWARFASRAEIRAYLSACAQRLSQKEWRAFVRAMDAREPAR